MPDFLVAVLHVHATGVGAWLAEVDRPGDTVGEAFHTRTVDLAADVVQVLSALDAGDLHERLLALAVAVDANDTELLQAALGDELGPGWGLPEHLPVVVGRAAAWAQAGAVVASAPLVAGAAVAGAKAVGAHAHLPEG